MYIREAPNKSFIEFYHIFMRKTMKRSLINSLILEAIDTFNQTNIKLPPFANWTAEKWKLKGSEIDEIKENGLGWDVTDCGKNHDR